MRHKGEKMYTLTQKVSKMTENANESGGFTSQGMPTIVRNYQTLGERHWTVSPSKPPEATNHADTLILDFQSFKL